MITEIVFAEECHVVGHCFAAWLMCTLFGWCVHFFYRVCQVPYYPCRMVWSGFVAFFFAKLCPLLVSLVVDGWTEILTPSAGRNTCGLPFYRWEGWRQGFGWFEYDWVNWQGNFWRWCHLKDIWVVLHVLHFLYVNLQICCNSLKKVLRRGEVLSGCQGRWHDSYIHHRQWACVK